MSLHTWLLRVHEHFLVELDMHEQIKGGQAASLTPTYSSEQHLPQAALLTVGPELCCLQCQLTWASAPQSHLR